MEVLLWKKYSSPTKKKNPKQNRRPSNLRLFSHIHSWIWDVFDWVIAFTTGITKTIIAKNKTFAISIGEWKGGYKDLLNKRKNCMAKYVKNKLNVITRLIKIRLSKAFIVAEIAGYFQCSYPDKREKIKCCI